MESFSKVNDMKYVLPDYSIKVNIMNNPKWGEYDRCKVCDHFDNERIPLKCFYLCEDIIHDYLMNHNFKRGE